MSLNFCSFSSGSSGNSYLIWSPGTALLIDAGISCKSIERGMAEFNLLPENLSGIFITHEHTDHVKSLRTLIKKAEGVPVYSSPGTLNTIINKIQPSLIDDIIVPVVCETGPFMINEIKITPFRLSHDAKEPLGYSFYDGEKQISVVTDTGVVTEEMFEAIKESDTLIIEANHDKNVLLMGRYPYILKQRIVGPQGHLSNEDAASCLSEILKARKNPGTPTFLLAHLSLENNTPDLAENTIKNYLEAEGYIKGREYKLALLRREEISEVY